MAKTQRAERGRPSALARAEHGGEPIPLDKAERAVLDEALRLGEDLAQETEAKILGYGRWILEQVFQNDTSDALDDKSHNPVWMELVRRAGGPTLRMSRRLLYVAVRVAAYDKRITAQSWRGLDAGRKELLLPLAEERRLRDAAQHVSDMNLSQAKTRAYVTTLLAADGKARQVRITGPALVGRVRKLRSSLEGAGVLRKIRELGDKLGPRERGEVAEEIDKLRELLVTVGKALRGR
jgi:hypothetical protein